MAKCVGICGKLTHKPSTKEPWIGVTAYYCGSCCKRIPTKDADRSETGKIICPCCGEPLRTKNKRKKIWEAVT